MAGKKENIKALFSNTRTRIIIVFTLILLLTTIIIGFVKFGKSLDPFGDSSDVSRAPAGIESIPGARNPTDEYVALQQKQNIQQAEQAQAKGTSAIPTIIRSQAFGDGVEPVGVLDGQGGIGFSTLARENISGPQSTIWFQNLKDTNCSKESINQAVNQNNASLSDLKLACTCEQIKTAGYGLPDLKSICSCEELKAIGFGIAQFKTAGYGADALRACGFVACEEHAAGFSALEMKNAGYSDGELKGAGFSDRDIAHAGGLPDSVTEADVRKAGCSVENLKQLRAAGVTAAAIRRISGCSAEQLKAAGFSALDLKNAGFSAAELKDAGFTAEQLKAAGFGARDLLDAGFTPDELAAAGYTQADIKAAENMLPAGFSAKDIQDAGCSPEAIKREKLAGVSALMIKKMAHCTASELSKGGFNSNDLQRAGFTPNELSQADKLSNMELAAAGCDPNKLKALVAKGVTAKQIHDVNGCGADVLKQLGFDGKSLLGADFTPAQLIAAGFAPESFDDAALKKVGCDVKKLKILKEQGVSAKRIHEVNGCSAEALKQAGFSAADLAAAGFTPGELLAAGFTPAELTQAGVALTPAGVLAAGRAGCSVENLKAARAMGVSATTIRKTLGCSAAALKEAGYSAQELKDAGFSAAELKNAGFNANELKAAGFSAKDLRAAGFSAADLKNAGFDAKALKEAGFSAAELKNAGFTADQLQKAGYSAKDLKDAGFGLAQLKNAGFSADELSNAGITQKDSALAGLEKIEPAAPSTSNLTTIPSIGGGPSSSTNQQAALQAENAKRLEDIMKRQQMQQTDQLFQQKVQQRAASMLSEANQIMLPWKTVATQQYLAGTVKDDDAANTGQATGPNGLMRSDKNANLAGDNTIPVVRMGDVLFAVIDTSINTDEPGPILATIVTGKLKGGKLIGTFNLPSNADKMVISFNSLSLPGAPKTLSINAFAVDPNTARTALSSETDHHYLMRYGSLFASTFLEGFGNAFQSADTTVTIGGTGGIQNTTVQNGIGRSALENAVIGLATVGKAWGQIAQQNMSRPTTVQVYSGTAIGVLFTQDLSISE
ncbi:MAG: type IVB secretion system protein DotG/IcmE [Legionellaceae bacterium]|nr:type IVB secretion system protein DotG/IcmE [Legionellaceae bacterium]